MQVVLPEELVNYVYIVAVVVALFVGCDFLGQSRAVHEEIE